MQKSGLPSDRLCAQVRVGEFLAGSFLGLLSPYLSKNNADQT